jgi:hypothetical protein
MEPQNPLTEQQGKAVGHVYPWDDPPVPVVPQVLSGETARTEIASNGPAATVVMPQASKLKGPRRCMLTIQITDRKDLDKKYQWVLYEAQIIDNETSVNCKRETSNNNKLKSKKDKRLVAVRSVAYS